MEKILIVDDEMFSRTAIEDILRAESVSYTHLYVYKRQPHTWEYSCISRPL